MSKQQRANKVLQGLAVIIVLGFIYLFVFLTFGVGIPCVFHKLTGWKCPGCGMTHAIAELWKKNIKNAFDYNALCVSVLPVNCLYLLYRTVRYVNGNDEGFYIWEYTLLIMLFVVTIGYGVMRNITFS